MMRFDRRGLWILIWVLLAACTAYLPATSFANADDAWSEIIRMDAGPAETPKSRDEVFRNARAHFARHRAMLESFVRIYPTDPRAFDARLKLAAITATEGKMDKKPAVVADALRTLMAMEAEPGITAKQSADAAFRRISLQMQSLEGRESEQRDVVVTAARNFAARYPSDPRAARLLVEASTICTAVPDTMRTLLTQAQAITKEAPLIARIHDDLRRFDRLGKPLDFPLNFTDGRSRKLSDFRGKVVALVFWSAESPHSLMWINRFRETLPSTGVSDLVVLGISLDTDRAAMQEAMTQLQISWPTQFDGKGWQSPLARELGINAVPTVWLVDRRGVLRSLNARDNYETTLRLLQRER